ncbi:MAG TPA: hypothetical protein PLP57_03460 [Candidatus Saccharicenans sp.]|jgi:hypothetical protein|nr:hypothetical protein [Candidatus Saccharicenans sp.]HRD01687.1 hypothetical protein [Candidatus Saccharicenans sp.]
MFNWVFALFHFSLYLGLVAYSVYSLIEGRWGTGLILLAFLTAYYFLVLHQGVLKEIKRKKKKPFVRKQQLR